MPCRLIQSDAVNMPSGLCAKCTITMFKEEIFRVGKTYQRSRTDRSEKNSLDVEWAVPMLETGHFSNKYEICHVWASEVMKKWKWRELGTYCETGKTREWSEWKSRLYIYMHGGEKGAKSNKARKTKLVLKGVAICVVRASQLLL